MKPIAWATWFRLPHPVSPQVAAEVSYYLSPVLLGTIPCPLLTAHRSLRLPVVHVEDREPLQVRSQAGSEIGVIPG